MHPTQKSIAKWEIITCTFIWTFAVLYSIFRFSIQCNKYFEFYSDDYSDFSQGWSVLSRKQDTADYEWQTVKFLIEKLFLWVLLSILLAEILRKFNFIKLLPVWQISITAIFILKELGVAPLIVILFQPTIFTLAANWRSKSTIWICNGLALFSISLYKNFSANEEFLLFLNLDERRGYVTILAIFWMNLRCVSYYLDILNGTEKENSTLNFISYCLYLPTVFCGPFISFKDFKASHQHMHSFFDRFTRLIIDISRFLFWLIFTEFWLHFVYVNATSFHPEWVETLDSWALYGYGYTMGQFFHIKYVVIYGLSTSLAKFENIPVPSLPICIGRVHLYSDMWKYFDAGLYNFLLKYIYIPSNKLLKSRLFGSLLCFTFVYIWHGLDDYILIWTSLNYVGIVIENLGEAINKKYLQNSKMVKKLGDRWIRRINCIIASPLLAMSAISNFYFFARSNVGSIFLFRFLNGQFLPNIILLGILYNCCQISLELRMKNTNQKRL